MKYFVLIFTDNNRDALKISVLEDHKFYSELQANVSKHRLIYREVHESYDAAMVRFKELQAYTRMQKERVIRKSNPNWVNLLHQPLRNNYHPGVKFNPKVPKLMSLR
ncbi:MAG TPA: hypothetical protein VKZ78_03230 [Sphingobacteriaceae bacterium]|nr:hypothetical protein [Sphingobacteriaceae bacterium]